jgi:hypothetical protein
MRPHVEALGLLRFRQVRRVNVGLRSSIYNALAELPAPIGPIRLKPRPLLAGEELGDHFRLSIVDAAAVGVVHFRADHVL